MVGYAVIYREKKLVKLGLLRGVSVLTTSEVVSSVMILHITTLGALHQVLVT